MRRNTRNTWRFATITTGTVLFTGVGLSLHSQAQPTPAAPATHPSDAAGSVGGAAADAAVGSAVHSISLPNVPTELPPGPAAGRETVGTACTFCHSARYILNQPAFPRQTWTNEVNKMRTTFGAPIAEQQVPAIVDYLVSIRGKPEPATRP